MLGCRIKADCPLAGLGSAGGVPYVGKWVSFQGILARIYASFRKKHTHKKKKKHEKNIKVIQTDKLKIFHIKLKIKSVNAVNNYNNLNCIVC